MTRRDPMRSRQAMPVIRSPGPIESLATLPGTAPAVASGATMRELVELERADLLTEVTTCASCGRPAHASETDDLDRCARCRCPARLHRTADHIDDTCCGSCCTNCGGPIDDNGECRCG